MKDQNFHFGPGLTLCPFSMPMASIILRQLFFRCKFQAPLLLVQLALMMHAPPPAVGNPLEFQLLQPKCSFL